MIGKNGYTMNYVVNKLQIQKIILLKALEIQIYMNFENKDFLRKFRKKIGEIKIVLKVELTKKCK